jgi:hypothetical protein
MERFVNRAIELGLIDEAVNTLRSEQRLLRTPLIEICGVSGIGKTSMLNQVKQRCSNAQIPYISIDIGQNTSDLAHEVINQVKQYSKQFPQLNQYDVALNQSAALATRALLKQGPVVLLLDSVDRASVEQLRVIEELLKDVIEDEKFFVVLAGKKELPFEQERSLARKLTTLQLKPLDRNSCETYLKTVSSQIPSEIRDIIFAWTRGYPLAMNIMVQAVQAGLDPRDEQGRKEILSQLTTRVIHNEVLAKVKGSKDRYMAVLQLLSIPRRFNLVVMQELIEAFEPTWKRNSSLAYFSLPREIHDTTDVLSWNMSRAGLSVDTSVRNLFLLLLHIEQPERYFAIHNFLAEINLSLAKDATGAERMRFLKEYLYHTACKANTSDALTQLQQAMQIITEEPPENFLQFFEEFAQDNELKEELGENRETIESSIQSTLARTYKQFAERSSGDERVRFLSISISHLMNDPKLTPFVITQNVQRLLQEESPEVASRLSIELASNEKFRALMNEIPDRQDETI